MKQLLLTLVLILTTIITAAAATQPTSIFTQDVVAINADGSMLPSVTIDPQSMAGMQRRDFDLGRKRLLQINTNIKDADQRGLNDLVATIRRCYNYIEAMTGQQLNRGILLYLVELDEVPTAYNFRASYNDDSQWGEVRLALIKRGVALSGKDAPFSLADLLYDTLPHELGHDVLNGIPQLAHDIDGDASYHTRWFIEGVCEVLAKDFSQREAPALYKRFLALRNVDTVLAGTQMQIDLLNWAQDNKNGLALESNLYGAAMLTMMAWTEFVTVSELLAQLEIRTRPVSRVDLLAMMQETTGLGPQEMIKNAHSHGKWLNEKILLAQLD